MYQRFQRHIYERLWSRIRTFLHIRGGGLQQAPTPPPSSTDSVYSSANMGTVHTTNYNDDIEEVTYVDDERVRMETTQVTYYATSSSNTSLDESITSMTYEDAFEQTVTTMEYNSESTCQGERQYKSNVAGSVDMTLYDYNSEYESSVGDSESTSCLSNYGSNQSLSKGSRSDGNYIPPSGVTNMTTYDEPTVHGIAYENNNHENSNHSESVSIGDIESFPSDSNQSLSEENYAPPFGVLNMKTYDEQTPNNVAYENKENHSEIINIGDSEKSPLFKPP